MKLVLTLSLILSLLLASPLAAAQPAIDGFSAERAQAPRRWEERFRAVPRPKSAREHLRILTREPHIAGTKADYDTANYVRDHLPDYGIAADSQEDNAWLDHPR